MQSEHSSSLKAGSTKNKQSHKGGITSQVRYTIPYTAKKASVDSKRPMSGTKPADVNGRHRCCRRWQGKDSQTVLLVPMADSLPRHTKSTLKFETAGAPAGIIKKSQITELGGQVKSSLNSQVL